MRGYIALRSNPPKFWLPRLHGASEIEEAKTQFDLECVSHAVLLPTHFQIPEFVPLDDLPTPN